MLEAYAERGVFRSLRAATRGNKCEFRFRWLWNLPFSLTFDARLGVLAFPELLPGIRAGSDLDAGLR
ncbi:MAG: hypothetical protein ACRD96_25855, partial [Bryobacteraceae bacterium]